MADGAVMLTDASVAGVTVKVVLSVAVEPPVKLAVAVILAVPAFCPTARPALDMVTTLVLELVQLVLALTSVVEPSV